MTVAPGAYTFGDRESGSAYSVVWWDPRALNLKADAGYGLRRDDLISKDGDPAAIAAQLQAYEEWRDARDTATARARVPSLRVRTATAVARLRQGSGEAGPGQGFGEAGAIVDLNSELADPASPDIEVLDFSRTTDRPFGPRFGSLVHATLATVPLDAPADVISRVAEAQGRILPTDGREPYGTDEVRAAAEVVTSLLKAPLFDRIRQAERSGRCDRELPITWKAPDGTLIEGTIDLAFEDLIGLTIVDFKTDRELSTDLDQYRRQLTVYCQALGTIRGVPARGILARV